MGGSACLKNDRVKVSPSFSALKLFGSGHSKFFSKLHFVGFFIHLKKTLGDDSSGREYTGKLSAEEMTFLTREDRVAVDGGVEVTSQDVLDHAGTANMFGANVGKLDPVTQKVISDPVDQVVNTCSALFLVAGNIELLGTFNVTAANPIVFLGAPHFTDKADAVSSRHDSETLNTLSKLESVFFSKADAGPFKHLSLFLKVRNNEFLVFRKEGTVSLRNAIVNLHT
jgi:hypothetical protein